MTTNIQVTGMHCASCKALVEDVASEVPGVISCAVDGATGRGVVEHDGRFDFSAFEKAVADLGDYRVARV